MIGSILLPTKIKTVERKTDCNSIFALITTNKINMIVFMHKFYFNTLLYQLFYIIE